MILTCPSCGRSMEASEVLIHKQVRCPLCQHVFSAELPKATVIDDNMPEGGITRIGQGGVPVARITPESVDSSIPDELGGAERLADLTRAVGSPKRRRRVHRRTDGTEDALMKMSGGSTAKPEPEGWYVKTDKGDIGPLNNEKLAEVIHKGLIKRDTKLRRGKDGRYVTAAEVSGLFEKPPVDMSRVSDAPPEDPPSQPPSKSSASAEKHEPHQDRQPDQSKAPRYSDKPVEGFGRSESTWKCRIDGQEHGPLNTEQLRQLAQTGKLEPTDLIWREGLPNWVPASKAKGLFPTGESSPIEALVASADSRKSPKNAKPGSHSSKHNPPGLRGKFKMAIIALLLAGLTGAILNSRFHQHNIDIIKGRGIAPVILLIRVALRLAIKGNETVSDIVLLCSKENAVSATETDMT